MAREIVNAKAFLSAESTARQKVDVQIPEMGNGTVIPVWGMTARERTEFEERQRARNEGQKRVRERILIACCRNDDGSPLFTEDDIELLGERSAAIAERLVNVALRVSGFTDTDVGTLAKN